MRRILFYGDSNTWGYRPGGGRLPANRRYTTMVTRQAMDVFPVVDGLNGRCSEWENPLFPAELWGGATFAQTFREAGAVAGLVIMLGTNDVMPPLNLSPEAIAENLRRMVRAARAARGEDLSVVLVSPPPLGEIAIADLAGAGADRAVLGVDLAPAFSRLAEEERTYFIAGSAFLPFMDAEDGYHMAEVGHLRLGIGLGSLLRSINFARGHGWQTA